MKYEDEKYYHLYNRGANKNPIFFNPDNYLFCLKQFRKYKRQYEILIFAYCLMPNHYHLLISQKPGGSISQFIQTVFNSYTQAINKAFKRNGTLFQGRVKGIEVTTDEYAVRLCRYIHNNPVAAKLSVVPEDWKYSDYRAWIELDVNNLSTFSLRDGYFRNSNNYKRFMEEYETSEVIQKFMFDE